MNNIKNGLAFAKVTWNRSQNDKTTTVTLFSCWKSEKEKMNRKREIDEKTEKEQKHYKTIVKKKLIKQLMKMFHLNLMLNIQNIRLWNIHNWIIQNLSSRNNTHTHQI